MPNKNFNNMHKNPPSTARPANGVYPATKQQQNVYPATSKNDSKGTKKKG